MKLIISALLVMLLLGCTTNPTVTPRAPAVLMTPPEPPIEIKESVSFKEFLEIVAKNNALANTTRIQLQELQHWIIEMQRLSK
jgi:hypothetical protein